MRIKCEEANLICDKSQYKDCTSWQRLKLELHLLFCKSCRKYSKDNAKLTKLIQKNLDELPKRCQHQEQLFMSEERKEELEKELAKKC